MSGDNGVVTDDFESFALRIDLNVSDIVGRNLSTSHEAEVFQFLVEKYYSSDVIYNQLQTFIRMYFDEALKLLNENSSGLILPD